MTPLQHALWYAQAGLYVFPCIMVEAGGKKAVKRPAVKDWQHAASTDAGRLEEWWGRWPGAMVGVAHRLTATVALDIDVKPECDGWQTYLRRRLAGDLDPLTLAFQTSSGGAQRLFLRPPELRHLSGNFAGSLGPGLDAIYGYSVLPSGMVATPGRVWVNSPDDVLVPSPAPAWVLAPALEREEERAAMERLTGVAAPVLPADPTRRMKYVKAAVEGEAGELAAVPFGQRHDAVFRAAFNAGRACARAGQPGLIEWCKDVIVASGGWTAKRVHDQTINDGLARGLAADAFDSLAHD